MKVCDVEVLRADSKRGWKKGSLKRERRSRDGGSFFFLKFRVFG